MRKDLPQLQILKWAVAVAFIAGIVMIGFTIVGHLRNQGLGNVENQWQFTDGGQFAVFESTVSDQLSIQSNRLIHKSPIGDKTIYKWDYSHGSWINFDMQTKGNVIDKGTIKTKSKGLIMIVGATDHAGEEIVPQFSYSDYSGELDQARFQASGAAHQPTDYAGTTLEYGIEVEDGIGGWIRMSGPYPIDEEDLRSFVVAPVFPRTKPELNFRVSRHGSPPLEISITNPGFVSSIATWTDDKKPWIKKLSFGDLRVREIALKPSKKTGREFPSLKFVLTPKNGRSPNEFRTFHISTADEMGNHAPSQQFAVMPGVNRLKYHAILSPSRKFRWQESDVVFLTEGILKDEKTKLQVNLTDEAREFGIKTASVEFDSRYSLWTHTLDWDVSKLSDSRSRPNNIFEFGGVLFLDDETVSTKFGDGGSSGGSQGMEGWKEFHRLFTWKGKIKKGQRIRLAMIPKDRKEYFEFVLPTSEFGYSSP